MSVLTMPTLRSVASVALLTVLVLLVDAAPVAAEPSAGDRIGGANGVDQGDFQMPFACGQIWGASTHSDHPAVDWNGVGPAAGANDHGHPVLAGLGGRVAAGGFQAGYGARVVVDHGDGWSSLYAHLSAVTVTVGETVSAATQIGNVGNTGASGGPHLHWEQRYLGEPVSVLWAGGAPVITSYGSPGPTYTSGNCPPRTFRVSLVPAPGERRRGPALAKTEG